MTLPLENLRVLDLTRALTGPYCTQMLGDMGADKPDIIYCSISGFGQKGPDHRRAAYDQVIQGLGGIMSVTGHVDGDPMRVGIALSDLMSGMNAAYAILAATIHPSPGVASPWCAIGWLLGRTWRIQGARHATHVRMGGARFIPAPTWHLRGHAIG